MDDPTTSSGGRFRRIRLLAAGALVPLVLVLVAAAIQFQPFRAGESPTSVGASQATPIVVPNEATAGSGGLISSTLPTQAQLPLATPLAGRDDVSSYQPTAPITAAFFYPWYPNQWAQGGIYPFTIFRPTLGLYNSLDDSI